ncbi:hypothetical protein amrb99_35280 [Actinomadura sp. RB99]|nr:hypothetical protein [Actinomadura sp. RB99]
MSWLNGFRRLHRRYERKPEHFLAFASIAAAAPHLPPPPHQMRRRLRGLEPGIGVGEQAEGAEAMVTSSGVV